MNTDMPYDTLETTRALEAAGADRKLSEAIAEAIRGATVLPDTSEFVTRDVLRAELANLKSAMDLSISNLANSTDLAIANLAKSTDLAIANLANSTDLAIANLKGSTDFSILSLKNSMYLTIGSSFMATVSILGFLIVFTRH